MTEIGQWSVDTCFVHILQTWTLISPMFSLPTPRSTEPSGQGSWFLHDHSESHFRLTPAKPENSTCFRFSPTFGVISLISVSPHVLTIVALICLITYKLYHSFLTCSFETIYSNPFPDFNGEVYLFFIVR